MSLTTVADLVRAGTFLTYVILAVLIARTSGEAQQLGKRWVTRFVLYAVLVTLGVTAVQRSFWPFSHWPMDHELFTAENVSLRAVVVDDRGTEHDLDLRALYPIAWMDLYDWLTRTRTNNADALKEAGPWLLEHIKNARAEMERSGRLPGDRGPFRSPRGLVVGRLWGDGDGLTPLRISGFRIYRYRSNLDDLATDPRDAPRTLFYEYFE